MDLASYKDFKSSRGLNYRYYLCAPQDTSKATILFCHGFPSTSYDWFRQVDYFKKQGYGILIPDLLGYGGTDKPTSSESYRMSLMVQDIIDILDHEKLENVVGVGHDWGGAFLSRLAYYHQERFVAFGFLASPYMPPNPEFNFNKLLTITEAAFGYPLFGYWEFFASDDASKIIEEHIDSFYSLLFPSDPLFWKEHFAPLGKAREWISSNRIEKRPSYLTEEELEHHKRILTQGGFTGPLCWYKAMLDDHTPSEERNLELDPERLIIQKPVFFGAAWHDYVCLPVLCLPRSEMAATQQFCPNSKAVLFDTDHWIMWAAPQRLNEALLDWMKSNVEGASSKTSLG